MNMFRTLQTVLGIVVPACAALAADSPVSQTPSSRLFTGDEQVVWQKEVDYWEFRVSGKIDEYMALWHRAFVGWPGSSLTVGGPEVPRKMVEAELRSTRPGSHKVVLEPLSVRLFGDTAVVFYRVFATRVDLAGRKIERYLRVTHTWMRTDGKWQIISGMSGAESEKKP